MNPSAADLSIQVQSVEPWQPPEGQPGKGVLLRTSRGDIQAIVHDEADTQRAIVWVWGARGGFDGPAEGIYGTLAEELKQRMTSLRINYRYPSVLHESVLDTLAGVSFLKSKGHLRVALVGHSFGGAVVIAAAPFSPLVKAVVALSSQTYGAANAAQVSPRPLLLVHGADDIRLPPQCSETIYGWAREPKELVILPGAGHSLRERKQELHALLCRWIVDKLGDADPDGNAADSPR